MFAFRRKNNEGIKAYAQTEWIVADEVDQSFRRIEEKDSSCEIRLVPKARPDEATEPVREETSVVDDEVTPRAGRNLTCGKAAGGMAAAGGAALRARILVPNGSDQQRRRR